MIIGDTKKCAYFPLSVKKALGRKIYGQAATCGN